MSAKPETDLDQGSKRTTILISKTILYFRIFSRIKLLTTLQFTINQFFPVPFVINTTVYHSKKYTRRS